MKGVQEVKFTDHTNNKEMQLFMLFIRW